MAINSSEIPVLPGVEKYAAMGLIPGGTIRNRDFRLPMIKPAPEISEEKLLIMFDAQTSGGLLIAVVDEKAQRLLERLHQQGIKEATVIGEILEEPVGKIIVR